MACIHRLILKKLLDRGLISEGNIAEQIKEINLAQSKAEAEAQQMISGLSEKEIEIFIKEFDNGSIIH